MIFAIGSYHPSKLDLLREENSNVLDTIDIRCGGMNLFYFNQ